MGVLVCWIFVLALCLGLPVCPGLVVGKLLHLPVGSTSLVDAC